MSRYLILVILVLVVGASAFGAGATVTLDGKTVSVPVIESNGRALVDVVVLMKLLGGSASYSAAGHKISISTTESTPAAGAAGTGELAGGEAVLGKVYTLVKSDPVYFSLKSAEYTTDQLTIGNTIYAPAANEKLLVLHFTVQNPKKKDDRFTRHDMINLTAVDAMNVNHDSINGWGDALSKQSVELNLKPAQNLSVYTAVVVPAKGVVPKLIVMPPTENDGTVLRYDLRDKVTPLKAPIADPADSTGATALPEVPASIGDSYALKNFDVTVEKTEYVTSPLLGVAPDDGQRYFVATLVLKNATPTDTLLRHDEINPTATSADGAEFSYKDMLFAATDTSIEQNLKAGAQMRVRIYFTVPQSSPVQKLSISEGDSRAYVYEIKQ